MEIDVPSEARNVIQVLGLVAHPEGGFYRETFRSPLIVSGPKTGTVSKERSASTAIYFLLPIGTFSAFHRITSDEVWHHYDGDPLDLHELSVEHGHRVTRLGRNLTLGERPQHVVSAGVYQAAAPVGHDYALCGCTVAPGFEFADFTMPSRSELSRELPEHLELIERFTR